MSKLNYNRRTATVDSYADGSYKSNILYGKTKPYRDKNKKRLRTKKRVRYSVNEDAFNSIRKSDIELVNYVPLVNAVVGQRVRNSFLIRYKGKSYYFSKKSLVVFEDVLYLDKFVYFNRIFV